MLKPIPLGPFELRHIIGKGGMGEVWSGLHLAEGMPVAIKVMTADGARKSSYLESFRNEVRAVAALHHHAIVAPIDYGEIDKTAALHSKGKLVEGSPYIVMELALRGSLRKYQDALGWEEIKVVLQTILEALAHAHAEGIIHRDLKPANVLVGCGTQAPGIKLTDFGLARLAESFEREGSVEQGWGTPHYMAPEQFRGVWRDYGPWTDLYALGCMAFELVDGSPPFLESSSTLFARAHTLEAPRPMKARIPVPSEFEDWVLRLLQKSPEDRFLYAADAAHALRLMETPASARKRSTVTLLPVKGPPTSLTADPSSDSWSWDELDRTIMDRPQTTQVVDESRIRDTSIIANSLHNEGLITMRARGLRRTVPPMPSRWQPIQPTYSLPQLYGAGLGLFGLRAIPMVGRETQRDHLWAALRRTRETRKPEVVFLRGGAGTGKSRLASWMARRAHEVGAADFMSASHNPSVGGTDGLARMVASHLKCIGLEASGVKTRIEELFRRSAHNLDLIDSAFSEIVASATQHGGNAGQNVERITRSDQRYALLTRYLSGVAAERPLVVILDDVQWGADALGFLTYTLERKLELPVLFLATLRDDLIDSHPVEAGLVRHLNTLGGVSSIRLPALTDQETDELVRGMLGLDGDLADEVETRSGGNPLFAVKLVTELVTSGKLQLGKHGFILKPGERLQLPENIFDLWAERLKRALAAESVGSRITLEIAAALGREISEEEWGIACSFSGIEPGPNLVSSLLEAGLIEHVEGGWQFEHGLLRETIEIWSKKKERWEAVNAACTEMLLKRYPNGEFPFVERMASFLVEANEGAASLRYRLDAAQHRVDLSDFARSEEHIRRFHETAQSIDLARSHEFYGHAQVISARSHIFRAHYDEASRVAQLVAIEARKHGWHQVLREATEIEAQGKHARGAYSDALRLYERALDAFRQANDLDGVGRSLLGLGRTREAMGEFKIAESLFEEARVTFEGNQNINGVARALNALGDAARSRGYLHTARNFSNQAMTLHEEIQNRAGVADCINDIAELYRMERNLDMALTWCMRSIELFESIGSDESMIARINLGLILREFARHSEAIRIFEQVREHFRTTRQLAQLAAADVHMLLSLAAMGDWKSFDDRLQEATAILKQIAHREPEVTNSLKLAAQFARGSNRETLAVAVVELERVEE